MICPICKKGETSVVDSRPTEDGATIRRRRLCTCGERFTTFERVQFREMMVVKKNGRKSPFDREKLSKSIYIALKNSINTSTFLQYRNIQNTSGFISIIELSGAQNSGPETRFLASKKRSVRKCPKMELLK